MTLILASVTGWLVREALPPRRCRKHSLQDVTVSSRYFFWRRLVPAAADATPGILPAPCTGLWGGTQGVAPGCCSPIFTFLCSGMDSTELSSRVKASFFLLPSLPPDPGEPWGSPSGDEPPHCPSHPAPSPQVSWLYLAARTLRVVAAKAALGCPHHHQL